MTRADLKASTKKELAEMAKRHRVVGWHAMRKEQLVDALTRVIRRNKARDTRPANGRSRSNGSTDFTPKTNGRNGKATTSPRATSAQTNGDRRPHRLTASNQGTNGSASRSDQLVAEVRDPHWIQARWKLSQRILDRAEAALGVEWHLAVPVIRVFDVTDGEASTDTKSWVDDVEIMIGTDNWYVPVADSPRAYKLQIGYRAPSGKFFTMARSRKITMPRPSGFTSRNSERQNGNQHNGFPGEQKSAEIAEAVRAQHWQNEHSTESRSGVDRAAGFCRSNVEFRMDAEIAIHGMAHPSAKLTLQGEVVETAADGSFSIQFPLAEGRQVIPAVMLTPDGNEQHTIVLAIERNTKHLEPRSLDEML